MGNITLLKLGEVGIILICIGAAILLGLGLYLLYHFIFSRNSVRRQVKELERKYSYLDALLIGQDSQYIHRLEIISRTNLLYVEKYNEFSRRFKEVFEGEDKFAESMIKQAKALIANNQFQNIKKVVSDTKKAIASFEEKVNQLDKDLFEVIKPEEEARHQVLKLKEDYRRVKQIFYANSNDLEIVTSSFTRVFDKLDTSFSDFENHIESAEYDEANTLIPVIGKVIRALDSALSQMPNLCILTQSIIPDKIVELTKEYSEVESSGIPLFNISYKHRVDVWNMTLESNRKKLVELQTAGVMESLDQIQKEIEETHNLLQAEMQDKDEFIKSCDILYAKVIELEKIFLKICALLPEVNNIYVIAEEQKNQINILKENMNKLGASKRNLDNFIHSSTKQPYSVLKKKLDDLNADYETANSQIQEFKDYLDSLKDTSEEAYTMVFAYYYHCKQVESLLRNLDIPDFTNQYKEQIETCYNLLNEIDIALKVKPIDVAKVNEKVTALKNIANPFFDDAENKCREAQLAESAIVYANRDRHHQKDVHQQLNVLEKSFYDGEFLKVYHDASAIYRRMHVEEEADGRK
ncbi:MAG TPA: septation ring formation regulator EzrA [Bacilli bacterium]|jgi:septation ring formation regulator EzrA|nr:septation ring formation regulator EzrA [Bacilli bacterium]HPY79593.1 septation ring formation regulator EzrA [Bacilli bacterium]HQA55932.1 septation ring formation regulator EzrA [Bacilli bacterium]